MSSPTLNEDSNGSDPRNSRHSDESTLHSHRGSDVSLYGETDALSPFDDHNEQREHRDDESNHSEAPNDSNNDTHNTDNAGLSAEPVHETPRPHNRVRFRSVSSIHGPELSHSRPLASEPLYHQSEDLTEIPLHERSEREEDINPAVTASTGRTPTARNDGEVSHYLDVEKQQHSQPTHSRSVKNRFKNAGQVIRQKTVRLGERLGRPLDDGETLNPSYFPGDLNGDSEYIPLRRTQTREGGGHGEDHGRGQSSSLSRPHTHLLPSTEAHRLVQGVTQSRANLFRRRRPRSAYSRSGQSTPERPGLGSRPPSFTGGGVLSQLLRLHASQNAPSHSGTDTASVTESEASDSQPPSGTTTPGGTTPGTATPKKEKVKWYKNKHRRNQLSIGSLVEAGMNLSSAHLPAGGDLVAAIEQKRPKKKKRRSTRLEDEIRVTVHIAEIIARQRYIIQLCRAFMWYGAPTHRLEEYMQMTARVLDIEGQFLYLPGCMLMSFDDPSTRTTEFKLVRAAQGVDLGRLADVHNIYKNVIHDLIGVEEASRDLEEIMAKKPRFSKPIVVLAYGVASAAVGPFAYDARPIDMPIIFLLGTLVGFMQNVLSGYSVLYANVFEVSAAILTSFLARAFGSISVWRDGEKVSLFCFGALAQSSIALILPGFLVLSGSLELQSHQMIAGSIRMVYAIIYSLFLGYGMTVGITIYGMIDSNATKDPTCHDLSIYGSKYTQRIPFVAIYTVLLMIVNQGKWKQAPVMVIISVAGYVTNYFTGTRLGPNSEVANTVGAFTIGVLGNLYSRLWHGHAATAILPAIFVLVPSGLSASGSLRSGLAYSEQVQNTKYNASSNVTALSSDTSASSLGLGMVEVAIGISVGLFVAALVVYPLGKRRSGLFSF